LIIGGRTVSCGACSIFTGRSGRRPSFAAAQFLTHARAIVFAVDPQTMRPLIPLRAAWYLVAGSARIYEVAETSQGSGIVGPLQAFEEFCERLDGEEEVRPPGNPARPVARLAAARHDAMHVRVMRQRPAAMCAGRRRRRSAPQPGTGSHRRWPVLERDGGDRCRPGEHDMEIGNRQKFGLAGGEPLRPRCAITLRTMAITAGDPRHAAVVARLDVTAERAAVRHATITLITRRSTQPKCPAWVKR
jgi:hypothetical protein